MQVQASKLNQTQTQLLLAMHLSDTPEDAKAVAHRSAKTLAAVQSLMHLNLVVVGDNGAALSPAGLEELKTNGYIDDTGESTEFGQRYYQQAVNSLNEEYQIIRDLLRD